MITFTTLDSSKVSSRRICPGSDYFGYTYIQALYTHKVMHRVFKKNEIHINAELVRLNNILA